MTPTYFFLVAMFFLIAIVMVLNLVLVEPSRYMKAIKFGFALCLLVMGSYYLVSGLEIIDTPNPLAREIYRIALILALCSLFSMFGVPVALYFATQKQQRNIDND